MWGKNCSNYGHCFNTESIRSIQCVCKAWHLNGGRILFTVTQDPLEHLMKIQRAVCVKHEHIHLGLLVCTGVLLSLSETLPMWFRFKYSSWMPDLCSTLIKWMPKGPASHIGNKNVLFFTGSFENHIKKTPPRCVLQYRDAYIQNTLPT